MAIVYTVDLGLVVGIVTLLVWFRAKMAATCKQFEFSLRSTSNEHYIEQNESSTLTLPTINDICCKSGIQATTMVVRLCAAVSGHKSKGWLRTAIGCKLLLSAGTTGIECHVSMALERLLDIVCTAVLGCSHLYCLLPPQLLHVPCSVRLTT